MRLEDRHWIVGLLEGEGCFTLAVSHYKRSTYRYPQVKLNMTDRDIVERAGHILGAPVCRVENSGGRYKDSFQIAITGTRALQFMEENVDLFGKRRQERIRQIIKLTSVYREKLIRLGRIGREECPPSPS